MLNEIFHDAQSLSAPVATGVLSGTPLRLGVLNAVALTDEGSVTDPRNVRNGVAVKTGGIGNKPGWTSIKTAGSYLLEVTGAVTVYGSAIYIKTDGTLTSVAAGAFVYGIALETKVGAAKAKLHVRLVQTAQVTANA